METAPIWWRVCDKKSENCHHVRTMTSTVLKMCLLSLMAIDLVTSDQDSSSSNRSAGDQMASMRRLQWKPQHYRHSTRSQKNVSPVEQSRYSHNTLKNRRPNIVLILTDDQDVELGMYERYSFERRLQMLFEGWMTRAEGGGDVNMQKAYATV